MNRFYSYVETFKSRVNDCPHMERNSSVPVYTSIGHVDREVVKNEELLTQGLTDEAILLENRGRHDYTICIPKSVEEEDSPSISSPSSGNSL